MTDEYVPTTQTVEDVYATAIGLPEAPKRRAWFQQWLADHENKIIIKHLEILAGTAETIGGSLTADFLRSLVEMHSSGHPEEVTND